MKKKISTLEFADLFGVSRKTVERMINSGKIKAVKLNPTAGKTSPFVIPYSELIRLLEMREKGAVK